MLIALTIMLLSGGGNNIWLFPEDFSDRVEAVIVEENRQSEIINLFDEISESVTTHNDRVKEMADNVSMLNRNPDATDRDFEQMFQTLLQERKALQTGVLDARIEMALKFRQNEWEQIFSTDSLINNN